MTEKPTAQSRNDSAQTAVLIPILSARTFKRLFVFLFCLLAVIVLFAPDPLPTGDGTWHRALELAMRIPDVPTFAPRTAFPVAAALGYAFAITTSIPLAVIGLFVRLRLWAFEDLQRKGTVRYRVLMVAFLLSIITIPFYVENLGSSLLTERFHALLTQFRATLLVYFGGLFGVLTLTWFWILFESITLIRSVRR